MARSVDDDFDWQPVIGRTLAYLCLGAADLGSATMLERAEFLMRLGLPRREAAVVLGTTDDSLRGLANQKARKAATPKRKQ